MKNQCKECGEGCPVKPIGYCLKGEYLIKYNGKAKK